MHPPDPAGPLRTTNTWADRDATRRHDLHTARARAGSLYSRVLTYVTAIALGTLLLPPCRHSERVVAALDACIFRHWKRHISLRVVHEAGFDANQQYVVAAFPHGVFPLAAQMHATVWPSLHHHPLSLLAASVNFYCPLWRHYMSVGAPSSIPPGQRPRSLGLHVCMHGPSLSPGWAMLRQS